MANFLRLVRRGKDLPKTHEDDIHHVFKAHSFRAGLHYEFPSAINSRVALECYARLTMDSCKYMFMKTGKTVHQYKFVGGWTTY